MSAKKLLPLVLLGGGLWWATRDKKKKSSKAKTPPGELPADSCGLYPWLPQPVDAAITERTNAGERNAEALAMHAARTVYGTTPEGAPQAWPPAGDDARAQCILGRIKIRVNLILAQLADDEADDDEPDPSPPGPRPGTPPLGPDAIAPLPGTCPEGYRYDEVLGCVEAGPPNEWAPWDSGGDRPGPDPEPPIDPEPVEPVDPPDGSGGGDGGQVWPEYPPPGPVDLGPWTDPANYPTPGMFHQIGGENSGVTLKAIARKALTTAFYLVLGDLDEADRLARRSENWRAYRQVINCCPWNHLLYGAPSLPGEIGFYPTPSGDSVSLYPVHDHVAQRLANGETPDRRVHDDDRKRPGGGKHAFLWLPPLDELALSEGRVEVKREYWETGDWVIMPPPEVLTLGVTASSDQRVWGCDGWEIEFSDTESRTAPTPRMWFHPRTALSLRRSG
ncbi:MAG: hypothetical protein ACE37F_25325 [Nannocystaceae bacterium]|nr:hypothetical protein [bacterium]